MGIGFYLAGINIACNVLGLGFLCKYNRHMELLCNHTGNADSGCLDGEDLIYLSIRKSALKFLSNFAKKLDIHLMI